MRYGQVQWHNCWTISQTRFNLLRVLVIKDRAKCCRNWSTWRIRTSNIPFLFGPSIWLAMRVRSWDLIPCIIVQSMIKRVPKLLYIDTYVHAFLLYSPMKKSTDLDNIPVRVLGVICDTHKMDLSKISEDFSLLSTFSTAFTDEWFRRTYTHREWSHYLPKDWKFFLRRPSHKWWRHDYEPYFDQRNRCWPPSQYFRRSLPYSWKEKRPVKEGIMDTHK